MGDQGAEAIADALKVNKTLQRLNLSSTDISYQGAEALADALKENNTLQVLNLDENSIGDQGAKALADALKENKTLQKLDLHENGIEDQGAKALADALKVNKALKILELNLNTIEDQGAKALADALKENKTLQMLDLHENGIEDQGAEALADALKVNKNIDLLLQQLRASAGAPPPGANGTGKGAHHRQHHPAHAPRLLRSLNKMNFLDEVKWKRLSEKDYDHLLNYFANRQRLHGDYTATSIKHMKTLPIFPTLSGERVPLVTDNVSESFPNPPSIGNRNQNLNSNSNSANGKDAGDFYMVDPASAARAKRQRAGGSAGGGGFLSKLLRGIVSDEQRHDSDSSSSSSSKSKGPQDESHSEDDMSLGDLLNRFHSSNMARSMGHSSQGGRGGKFSSSSMANDATLAQQTQRFLRTPSANVNTPIHDLYRNLGVKELTEPGLLKSFLLPVYPTLPRKLQSLVIRKIVEGWTINNFRNDQELKNLLKITPLGYHDPKQRRKPVYAKDLMDPTNLLVYHIFVQQLGQQRRIKNSPNGIHLDGHFDENRNGMETEGGSNVYLPSKDLFPCLSAKALAPKISTDGGNPKSMDKNMDANSSEGDDTFVVTGLTTTREQDNALQFLRDLGMPTMINQGIFVRCVHCVCERAKNSGLVGNFGQDWKSTTGIGEGLESKHNEDMSKDVTDDISKLSEQLLLISLAKALLLHLRQRYSVLYSSAFIAQLGEFPIAPALPPHLFNGKDAGEDITIMGNGDMSHGIGKRGRYLLQRSSSSGSDSLVSDPSDEIASALASLPLDDKDQNENASFLSSTVLSFFGTSPLRNTSTFSPQKKNSQNKTSSSTSFVSLAYIVATAEGDWKGFRLWRFRDCALFKDRHLVWTQLPILGKKSSLPTQLLSGKDATKLGIDSPPPFPVVVKHLRRLCENENGENKQEKEEASSTGVRSSIVLGRYGESSVEVFQSIYKYLSSSSVPSSNLRSLASLNLPLIPSTETDSANVLVSPSRMYFRLPNTDDLHPFMFEVPRCYGAHASLLKNLGVMEHPTKNDYVALLRELALDCQKNVIDKTDGKVLSMRLPLNPNELQAVHRVIDFILNKRKKRTGKNTKDRDETTDVNSQVHENDEDHDELEERGALNPNDVYIPDCRGVLVPASSCVYRDACFHRRRPLASLLSIGGSTGIDGNNNSDLSNYLHFASSTINQKACQKLGVQPCSSAFTIRELKEKGGSENGKVQSDGGQRLSSLWNKLSGSADFIQSLVA
eukprot:g350.t1